MTYLPFRPAMVRDIPDQMKSEQLLQQKGWFSLPEVFRTLFPTKPNRYKLVFKQVARLSQRGLDPWVELGYFKFRHRVFVRMELFGPWLLSNPLFQLQRVPEGHNFEDFLKIGSGFFRLSEICNLFGESLPFTYLIFKRQVDRAPDGLSKAGIFKFDKTYILDLEKFCRWLATQFKPAS